MNIKSLVKETIKEVVAERQINLFVEKNTPTQPSNGLIISHKLRRNLMFIHHLRKLRSQQKKYKACRWWLEKRIEL